MVARHAADMFWRPVLLLGALMLATAATPAPPAKLMESQYQLNGPCSTTTMHEPANTRALAKLVAQYYALAQNGTQVTVRMSRPYYHSTASFACPDSPGNANSTATPGGSGPPAALRVGLLNSKLNRVLAVDKSKLTLRVGAGMTLEQLTAAATKNNMSVQMGALTAYSDLTVGGTFLTGAHGSGFMTTHSMADTVLEVTWVTGTGRVRVSRRSDPEFKALPGSLGRLGAVSELLLQLTPPTATTLTTISTDDTNLFTKVKALLQQSPYTCVAWQPDGGQVRVFQLKQAPLGTKIEPRAKMSLFPNLATAKAQSFVKLFRRGLDVWTTTLDDDSTFCSFVKPLGSWFGPIGFTWAAVKGVGVFNVTGNTNDMQTGGCGTGCLWGDSHGADGAAWHDVDFALELDQLEGLIADVKRLIDVELRESGKRPGRCITLGGIITFRFGQPSDSLVSMTAGMKQPVFVQTEWFRSYKHPDKAMHYQFVLDLFEELALCKYNARPHPGKNFDRTFSHPRCPITLKYPQLQQLSGPLAQQYDPAGLFNSRLFDRMASGQAYSPSPKCTLTQQCYCQQDEHCPDGMACVDSLAFPEYKVCKGPMNDKPGAAWNQISPFIGG